MSFVAATVLLLSLLLMRTQSVLSLPDTTGYWISRSPLPTARQEIAHAVLDGRIYIPGGLAQGGIGSSLVEVFDPATNSWSAIAPLPEALHHMGFATANGKLYVLGGYTGSTFSPTNRVYEYTPSTNSWLQKTPMPVARGAHIAAEYAGKVYVIGGVQVGVGVVGRTDVYDPVGDTWQQRATMPTVREHLAAAVMDSLIYVVGGRAGGNRATLEAYSPATNTWYALPPMPTARSGLAAAALRGRLYVFGGEIPGVFPQNEEYDPATMQWTARAPMPTPRHGIGAAVVGDSIFIIGGGPVEGLGVTTVNEAFVPPAAILHSAEMAAQPSSFVLYQNYPNPLNPSTTFAFSIQRSAFVILKVHDLLGREVATLVNEQLTPGHYRISFNATYLASGAYIYRLQSGPHSQSRLMLLLR